MGKFTGNSSRYLVIVLAWQVQAWEATIKVGWLADSVKWGLLSLVGIRVVLITKKSVGVWKCNLL